MRASKRGSWRSLSKSGSPLIHAIRQHRTVNREGNPLFGGGPQEFDGCVPCFQQVLTDNNPNVLAVFTEERPPPSAA